MTIPMYSTISLYLAAIDFTSSRTRSVGMGTRDPVAAAMRRFLVAHSEPCVRGLFCRSAYGRASISSLAVKLVIVNNVV